MKEAIIKEIRKDDSKLAKSGPKDSAEAAANKKKRNRINKEKVDVNNVALPTLLLQDLMYRVKAAIVTVRVARPTDREITTEEITTIKIASRNRLSNRK